MEKMIDTLRIYLLVGTVLTTVEQSIWIILSGKLFESEKTEEKVGEGIAFFVRILIWPYGIYLMALMAKKIHNRDLSDEEWKLFIKGYEQGVRIRERWFNR